jgi:hypothetical protein
MRASQNRAVIGSPTTRKTLRGGDEKRNPDRLIEAILSRISGRGW